MKNISKHFINCIKDKNKRQKYFALFAFIFSICYQIFTKNNNTEIIKSVVTAAVAAGGAIASSAGGAATAGGAIASSAGGAATAGGAAAGSAAAGTSTTTATGSAVASSSTTNSGAVTSKAVAGNNAAIQNSTNNIVKTNQQVPKQNVANTAKQSDSMQANSLKEKPSTMNSETSKEMKKDASKSDVSKEKKDSKRNSLSSDRSASDDENETEMDGTVDAAIGKSKLGKLLFFIVLIPFLIIIYGLPLMASLIVSPTSKTMSGFDCENKDSLICKVGEGISDFSKKAKNLFLYGHFDTNNNIIIDKVNEVYEKIYNEYNIEIDAPLLVSSVMVDATSYQDEIDGDNNTIEVNSNIKERLNYLEELARMQLSIYEISYVCVEENIDGESIYVKKAQGREEYFDTEKIEEECNGSNVGETIYDYFRDLDIDGYYDRLKEHPQILKDIYGEEKTSSDGDISLIIQKIKLSEDLFEALYGKDTESLTAGNVPNELFSDDNVHLQTPLNGNYSIASFYGERSGIYKGFHKGIDVVSSDVNIYAAGDGIVTNVYTENLGGNVIEITHIATDGSKYVTQYAHLSKFLVSKGDVVYASDTIGIMGKTGDTSGVHLHFQMWEVTTGKTYNPLNLFVNAINYPSQNI